MSKFVSFFGIFPLLAQELTSPFRTRRARGKWAMSFTENRKVLTLQLAHFYYLILIRRHFLLFICFYVAVCRSRPTVQCFWRRLLSSA